MTSSKSRTARIAIGIGLALVVMAGAAYAERKRVVVLEFEGPKAEKFHDDLVNLIKKTHTVISSDRWNGVAEDMDAAKVNEKNIKKVAKKLKIDGVVTGKIEKRRDEYIIHLKLREGKTGELVGDGVETKADGPRIDGSASKDIKDELIGAINDLEANHGGGGDDDGDDDAKPKKAAAKKKTSDDDGDDDAKPKKAAAKKKTSDDDGDDGDSKPKKAAAKKKTSDDDGDDNDGKKKSAFSKKKKTSDDDGNDDDPRLKKTAAKKKTSDDDGGDDDGSSRHSGFVKKSGMDDDGDSKPKKTAAKKKTSDDDSTDDPPAKSKKKKTDDDAETAAALKTKKTDDDGGGGSGDDDPPKKSSKKKKVAQEDDDRVTDRVDVGGPQGAEALTPVNRAIDGSVGASFTARKLSFNYASSLGNPPPTYSNSLPLVGAFVDVTLYPLALGHKRASKDILNGLGFTVQFDRVLFINSQKQYTNMMNNAETVKLATTEQRYEFGPVFRYAIGDKLIGAKLLFEHQDFAIDQNLPADAANGQSVDIPDVSYNAFTPSVFTAIPLSPKLDIVGDAGLIIVTSAGSGNGQLDNAAEYGRSTKLGFEISAGADYLLTSTVFVRAVARFEQIGMKFAASSTTMANDRDPSNLNTQSVFGAKDVYYGGAVTIGYLF